MNMVSQDNVVLIDDEVYFHGRRLPAHPAFRKSGNTISVCNHKLYINGYEWCDKENSWKRTISALFHTML